MPNGDGSMRQESEEEGQWGQSTAIPPRHLPDFVDTYYAGCSMVVSSPVDICVYFGRYTLKDLETGRPNLVQLFEKQVYLTPDEAERVGQAILRTVQVFKAAQRGELKPGVTPTSEKQSDAASAQTAAEELIKV